MNVGRAVRSFRDKMQAARDALDPEAAEARRRAAADANVAAIRRTDDIRWLMNDERGRRIVKDLLDRCGLQVTTLNERGRVSPVLEGRRTVAIEIAREVILISPGDYLRMLTESLPVDALKT